MSSPGDNSPVISCSICSGYVQENRLWISTSRYPDPSQAVHQSCSECDTFNIGGSQLCNFCSHIRPGHLLTCGPEYCGILLGTLTELYSGKRDCAFCRWCLEIIQTDARQCRHTVDEKGFVRVERHEDILLYYDIQVSKSSHDPFPQKRGCVWLGHNKQSMVFSTEEGNSLTSPGALELGGSPILPPVVDWATVRDWRNTCDSEHGNCHKTGIGTLPVGFRLIDVEMESVVSANVDSVVLRS